MARGLISYLKLIRLPNVFSALADIIAGYTIANCLLAPPQTGPLEFLSTYANPAPWLLCVASVCLYLSGMAFNDIADLKADTRERPKRPIPSGEVSLSGAWICAFVLMLAGLLSAFFVGQFPLVIAGILALAILFYDFIGKQPAASMLLGLPGPLALGVCRASNVLLGMSAAPGIQAALLNSKPWDAIWLPALASGFFGAGITAFSVQEETGKKKSAIVLGWIFMGGACLATSIIYFRVPFNGIPSIIAVALLTYLFRALILKTIALSREGTPHAARMLVLAGLKSYCPLDAAMILMLGGITVLIPAGVVFLLLFPGGWLRKKLAQMEA